MPSSRPKPLCHRCTLPCILFGTPMSPPFSERMSSIAHLLAQWFAPSHPLNSHLTTYRCVTSHLISTFGHSTKLPRFHHSAFPHSIAAQSHHLPTLSSSSSPALTSRGRGVRIPADDAPYVPGCAFPYGSAHRSEQLSLSHFRRIRCVLRLIRSSLQLH